MSRFAKVELADITWRNADQSATCGPTNFDRGSGVTLSPHLLLDSGSGPLELFDDHCGLRARTSTVCF